MEELRLACDSVRTACKNILRSIDPHNNPLGAITAITNKQALLCELIADAKQTIDMMQGLRPIAEWVVNDERARIEEEKGS